MIMKLNSVSLLIMLALIPLILSKDPSIDFRSHLREFKSSKVANYALSCDCLIELFAVDFACRHDFPHGGEASDDTKLNKAWCCVEYQFLDCLIEQHRKSANCTDDDKKQLEEEYRHQIELQENGPCVDYKKNSTECQSNSNPTSATPGTSSVNPPPTEATTGQSTTGQSTTGQSTDEKSSSTVLFLHPHQLLQQLLVLTPILKLYYYHMF